jgi:hypothetical protein
LFCFWVTTTAAKWFTVVRKIRASNKIEKLFQNAVESFVWWHKWVKNTVISVCFLDPAKGSLQRLTQITALKCA